MENNIPAITRKELYSLVWTMPTSKLCKHFGISDSGLAKLCKRYEIPKPGLGYWRRKETGQTDERPSLPTWEDNNLEIHELLQSENKQKKKEQKEQKEQAEKETLSIQLPKRLSNPHSLITEAKKVFAEAYRSEYGSLRPREPTLNIRVTKGSLPRALRIMDTLIKELEGRGHRVAVEETSYSVTTKVYVNDYSVEIAIAERQVQAKKEPYCRAVLKPTGCLCLELIGAYRDHRRNWSDGRRQRIENLLGDFILELESLAAFRKKEHEKREKEWKESETRQEQIRLQEERIKKLHSLVDKWQFHNSAKALLLELDNHRDNLSETESSFLDWAHRYVKEYNLLVPTDS